MLDYKKRRSISFKLNFNYDNKTLWEVISAPNNLELFHPYCKSNNTISWEKDHYSDEIIYLNNKKYKRVFLKWNKNSGYELLISNLQNKKSYVIWEITETDNLKSNLRITIYPHLLATWPKMLSYLPFKFIIEPRLKSYLFSVISGLNYFLNETKKVPKNHFGTHKWFS
tara:strand:+ start:14072 stop:14578 length:507 start_codon:yes stop_codon:yes gene_type:complete